ncbi:uncharacterized protein [Rutidosis leptorrhynchoides]|uniref:uncharacterized protein n=1 Tax=Rutidosis leptorrhynchoides TaxID=125765 RepID=UPI003A98D7D0
MNEEAVFDTQTQRRRLVTKPSSIKRKPLASLTNIIRKPQSKKRASSTASDSSIGSTQNPIHLLRPISTPPGQNVPSQPQRLTTDRLVGDANCYLVGQRQSARNTGSNTKDVAAFRQIYFEGTRSSRKEGSVSLCSSTLDKVKDQGNVNQSCLDKTKNDGKIIYKRKDIDVPLSARHTKDSNNSVNTPVPHSTVNIKDKRQENIRKDKGKEIVVLDDYPSMKCKGNMVKVHVPFKGVVINDRGETVSGSSRVDTVKIYERKVVATPVNNRTMEKMDTRSSCLPLWRATSNRNDTVGAADMIQFKPQTEPPPNKKKRRCSSKKEYTLTQEYVEQQRAYFKEIDDFELEVEEI